MAPKLLFLLAKMLPVLSGLALYINLYMTSLTNVTFNKSAYCFVEVFKLGTLVLVAVEILFVQSLGDKLVAEL